MSIREDMVRTYLGDLDPPPALTVGLARGGVEVSTDGYERRIVSRGSWTIGGATARATVRFGPFAEAVAGIDSVLVYRGEDLLEVRPFEAVTVGRGMSLEHDLVVEATEVES